MGAKGGRETGRGKERQSVCVSAGGDLNQQLGTMGVGGWGAVEVAGGGQLQTYAGWQVVERWIAVVRCQRSSFIAISTALFTWYF